MLVYILSMIPMKVFVVFQSGLVNIMCGYGVQESPVSTVYIVFSLGLSII